MSFVRYEYVRASATSSGSVTTYSTGTYTGYIHAVRYNAAAATSSEGISSGGTVTLAVTAEVSGLSILTLADASSAGTADYYPRAAHNTIAGGASTGAAMVPLRNERLAITFTSGSTTQDTKYGRFYFYVG